MSDATEEVLPKQRRWACILLNNPSYIDHIDEVFSRVLVTHAFPMMNVGGEEYAAQSFTLLLDM
jgi:hypothetical protein